MLSVVVGQVLIAMLLLALSSCVVLLRRRIGGLMLKVAPAGALMTAGGPAAGTVMPILHQSALDGSPTTIGGSTMRSRLLLFVGAGCPISAKLIPIARDVAEVEKLDLVFLGDDAPVVQRTLTALHRIPEASFINSAEVGMAFGIDKLPYAALLDVEGRLVARGLVNSREHLESLLVARETGHTTVQSYLEARARAA